MKFLPAIGMRIRGVSPVAIRDAKLHLKEAGIEVPQHRLEAHFLNTHDLSSLIARQITNENRTEGWIDREFAEDLVIHHKLAATQSDKIKRPLESAIAIWGSVIIVALGCTAIRFLTMPEIHPLTVKITLGVIIGIIGVAFGYSYTASRIGKVRAGKIFSLLLGVGLVIGLWIITRVMS